MRQFIKRQSEPLLKQLVEQYPVVTLTGPRQSGKTTMCRMTFPDMAYANLEEPDTREFAATDPRGFLAQFSGGAILDEIQRVPELTSFIQVAVDAQNFKGNYIITGSQNLSVSNTVNQSLAGRTALLTLLPFSFIEISDNWTDSDVNHLIYKGGYPRIYHRKLNPTRTLSDYTATYIERDVRRLSMVKDLTVFQKFLGLCAGRTGQLLNYANLSNDTGVAQTTIKEWFSILEASYICFRLPPYSGNLSKRLVKSPKLFFYDTGLAAYLMGINSVEQIAVHPLRGMLFENLIVTEVMKYFLNNGRRPGLMFYRDSNGNEVDLVIQRGTDVVPIEIKSAATVNRDFFKGLKRFKASVSSSADGILVYGGSETRMQNGVQVICLDSLDDVLSRYFH